MSLGLFSIGPFCTAPDLSQFKFVTRWQNFATIVTRIKFRESFFFEIVLLKPLLRLTVATMSCFCRRDERHLRNVTRDDVRVTTFDVHLQLFTCGDDVSWS